MVYTEMKIALLVKRLYELKSSFTLMSFWKYVSVCSVDTFIGILERFFWNVIVEASYKVKLETYSIKVNDLAMIFQGEIQQARQLI